MDRDPDLSGLRLLVVEDDADTCGMLATALEVHGATVTPAASAREGLRILERLRHDLVVTDIVLPPGEDGFWLLAEVLRLFRQPARPVPVVAVTAHALHGRYRALSAGFSEHLTKPVDPDVLCRTVAGLTGRAA